MRMKLIYLTHLPKMYTNMSVTITFTFLILDLSKSMGQYNTF